MLPVSGRFPKEGWEACLWHTILLARSSVLYLLFREADKGVMSPYRTAHFCPPKMADSNCEVAQGLAVIFMKEARAK